MKTSLWRNAALTLTLIAVVSMSAYAQRGGRGGGGGFGGGGFGGGAGGFGGLFGGGGGTSGAAFALRADVKKELKLSADQESELQDLSGNAVSMRDVFQDLDIDFRAMRDMEADERAKITEKIQTAMAKRSSEADKEVLDILKSTQKSRFKELKFQYEVSRGRATSALAGADVKLNDSDEETLTEAIRAANAELNAKINELRMKMYAEAISKVVSASKVESLMGDLFTFESTAGQRGGGRTNRGGGPAAGGGRGNRGAGGPAAGSGNNPRRRPARPSADEADDAEEANPRRRR